MHEAGVEHRRAFLRGAVGLAAASAAQGAGIRRLSPFDSTRQQTAYQIRQSAALFQCNQPEATHPTNGDESALPPPLRERPDDIPLLVRHFVQQFARRMGKAVDTIPTETMNVLVRYHWPGNIRELQNLVERAVILSAGPILKVPLNEIQAQPAPAAARKIGTLEEAERRHILEALEASEWVISGPKGAASSLGMKRSTLQARMEKLGIRRARAAAPSPNSR